MTNILRQVTGGPGKPGIPGFPRGPTGPCLPTYQRSKWSYAHSSLRAGGKSH